MSLRQPEGHQDPFSCLLTRPGLWPELLCFQDSSPTRTLKQGESKSKADLEPSGSKPSPPPDPRILCPHGHSHGAGRGPQEQLCLLLSPPARIMGSEKSEGSPQRTARAGGRELWRTVLLRASTLSHLAPPPQPAQPSPQPHHAEKVKRRC